MRTEKPELARPAVCWRIFATNCLKHLIDVYALRRRESPDPALLIVGDGAHGLRLRTYAQAIGADGVLFVGQVLKGVSRYFLLGDVFVLPGLGGLAISHAMVHGLPVVATEGDGCECDLIEPGMNGYRLPVGNISALTGALREILLTPGRSRQMGEHSRWIIDHRYNIQRYISDMLAACEYAYRSRSTRRTDA